MIQTKKPDTDLLFVGKCYSCGAEYLAYKNELMWHYFEGLYYAPCENCGANVIFKQKERFGNNG